MTGHEVESRRGVDGEHLDVPVLGGEDERFVAVIFDDPGDSVRRQSLDHGVAGFHADLEPPQRLRVDDPAEILVREDGHFERGVGRAEVVEPHAFRRLEDRVDDIGAAGLHERLRGGPVGRDKLDGHAGGGLPEPPLVGQDADQVALGIPERVGRIGVVHDDHDALDVRLRGRSLCGGVRCGKQRRRRGQHPEQGADAG